jgi:phosphoglucosamine mutase
LVYLLPMGEFFGTDGIRGAAGKFPLDERTIERIGYSLAKELKIKLGRGAHIVIGGDTRESGAWIEQAIARGASAADAKIQSAGVITTPGVAYLTRTVGADAGVVISASHNPYEDNGIKVFGPTGRKLDEATEQAIERDLKMDATGFTVPPHAKAEPEPELRKKYLAFLQNEIAAGLDLSGMKIVVDCANGASYEVAPALFRALGAEVHAINVEPNGKNINLGCGSLHPETLKRAVVDNSAQLGLAFDGDADRCLLVDETGKLVDGDQVLFVMAEYLDSRSRLSGRRVVATVMSNLGLEVVLTQRNIELVRTPVGDKYVLEELLTNGGTIGGEQSGHIIFPEISLAGDGIITALEMLRVMIDSKKPLSELTRAFTSYPQVIVNVQVSSKPPFESVAPIYEAICDIETQLAKQGRLLVRYSGTENLARVMLEGPDEDTIQEKAHSLANLIRKHIG